MEPETTAAAVDALVDAARRRAWSEVETLWLERIESKTLLVPAFLEAARLLAGAGERDRLGLLAAMTAPPLLAAGDAAGAMDLLRIAASLCGEDTALGEHALQAARILHAKHSACESFLARADLERGEGLAHLMRLLGAFFRFDVGDFAMHSSGWGMGEVKKIVPRREELGVLFESGRSHVFPIRSAGDYLVRVPPDRLDFLLRKDRPRLQEEAEKDPLRLVGRALAFKGGPMDGRELKSLLVPAVLDESRWTDWWAGVRLQLRKSQTFDFATGPNSMISARTTPLLPSADVRKRFLREPGFWDRARILRTYVRAAASAEADAGFVAEALGALAGLARSDPEKAALAFLREDARKAAPAGAAPPPPDFPSPEGLADFLRAIEIPEYKERLLEEAKGRWPDAWPGLFSRLLFNDDPEAWEAAVSALLKAGRSDLVSARIPALLAAPGKNPWAFLWLARNALHGHLPGCAGLPAPTVLLEMVLGVIHGARTERIFEGAEAKQLATKARGLLTEDAFRRAFEGVTPSEAKRLWHRIHITGLSPTVLNRAEKIVSRLHPEIVAETSAREEEAKEDVIWTTLAGLNRFRQDYDRLVNEDVPKNAEDLGRAIAMGDLSENAEYTAARETQQQLVERSGRMQADLRKARVFDPASVSADVAGIGTEVRVADATGKERPYTLLGPWDTDIERGVISYLSPIGQALIGRKPGERVTVQLPEGTRTLDLRAVRRAPQIEAAHGEVPSPETP